MISWRFRSLLLNLSFYCCSAWSHKRQHTLLTHIYAEYINQLLPADRCSHILSMKMTKTEPVRTGWRLYCAVLLPNNTHWLVNLCPECIIYSSLNSSFPDENSNSTNNLVKIIKNIERFRTYLIVGHYQNIIANNHSNHTIRITQFPFQRNSDFMHKQFLRYYHYLLAVNSFHDAIHFCIDFSTRIYFPFDSEIDFAKLNCSHWRQHRVRKREHTNTHT